MAMFSSGLSLKSISRTGNRAVPLNIAPVSLISHGEISYENGNGQTIKNRELRKKLKGTIQLLQHDFHFTLNYSAFQQAF